MNFLNKLLQSILAFVAVILVVLGGIFGYFFIFVFCNPIFWILMIALYILAKILN